MSGYYSYARVEKALIRVFSIPQEAEGAFRSRIKHLQKLGLAEEKPGKGVRIEYSDALIHRWLLALLFERLGMDPVAVVKFIIENWQRKPGAKYPVTSLQSVVQDALKAQFDRRQDYWLTIELDRLPGRYTAFPKIGRMQPFLKENAWHYFAASMTRKSDVGDLAANVIASPLTDALRRLEGALLIREPMKESKP